MIVTVVTIKLLLYLGNIEGMPATIKTVYVQHDDASDDQGVSLIDEMMAGKDMLEASVKRGSILSFQIPVL